MATPTQIRRRGRFSLILGTVVAALLVAAVAYADNFVNNVTVGGNDTITAGGSTTIGYKVNATGGDGQGGCNASDGSALVVTINAPSGVSVSSTDTSWNAAAKTLTFTACNAWKYVTFSSATAGNYNITHSTQDSGPATTTTRPTGR